MQGKVSVITPTYNHAKFIAECIESVQRQSYSNWEMIIVNDGSTDDTSLIARKHSLRDQRIIVIDQENLGVWNLGKNYNKGLQAATGEYVAILEGDDLWPSHTLSTMVERLNNLGSEFGMAYGKVQTFGRSETEVIGTYCLDERYEKPHFFSHFIFTPAARIPPQATLIRMSSLKNVGGFFQPESLPLVDRPTFLNISMKYKIAYIDEILAYWRQHGDNVTKNLSLQIAAGAVPWIENHFRGLPAEIKKDMKMNMAEAIKIHRRSIFLMSASYLQTLEHSDTLAARWQSLKAVVLPRISMPQRAVLSVLHAILLVGVDMRPVLRFIRNAASRGRDYISSSK